MNHFLQIRQFSRYTKPYLTALFSCRQKNQPKGCSEALAQKSWRLVLVDSLRLLFLQAFSWGGTINGHGVLCLRSKAESVFFAISALFRSCCSAGYYKRRKEKRRRKVLFYTYSSCRMNNDLAQMAQICIRQLQSKPGLAMIF